MLATIKKFLKFLYKWWMKFAVLLGTINGFIILTLFYFIIIGLYALPHHLIKLFKKPNKNAATYWKKKENSVQVSESVKYQF